MDPFALRVQNQSISDDEPSSSYQWIERNTWMRLENVKDAPITRKLGVLQLRSLNSDQAEANKLLARARSDEYKYELDPC